MNRARCQRLSYGDGASEAVGSKGCIFGCCSSAISKAWTPSEGLRGAFRFACACGGSGLGVAAEAAGFIPASRGRGAGWMWRTHAEVFQWVLQVLGEQGLIDGKTIGIDAPTLEANAALRSIVRRYTGESYEEFLTRLAKAFGIETSTRKDLAEVDKHRPGKGSNDDWEHPQDPDARIAKMKDGRTHLAHRLEHAVETGAVVGGDRPRGKPGRHTESAADPRGGAAPIRRAQ